MGISVRSLLQRIAILAAVPGLFAWSIWPANALIWALRTGGCCISAVCMSILILRASRRERLVDLLATVAQPYFERDGVCFAMRFTARDGICWLDLFVQNHHERTASIRIILKPHALLNTAMESFDEELVCAGAQTKVRRIPVPIAKHLAETWYTFDVMAITRFPGGMGRRVRFREGLAVTSIKLSLVEVVLGLITLGLVLPFRPSTARLYVPAGCAFDVPENMPGEEETFPSVVAATQGFPIEPL